MEILVLIITEFLTLVFTAPRRSRTAASLAQSEKLREELEKRTATD